VTLLSRACSSKDIKILILRHEVCTPQNQPEAASGLG